jgi:hypothetical protein
MLKLAGRHLGIAGFVPRLELIGHHGNAIEIQRRTNDMSDEQLKARAIALIAKL